MKMHCAETSSRRQGREESREGERAPKGLTGAPRCCQNSLKQSRIPVLGVMPSEITHRLKSHMTGAICRYVMICADRQLHDHGWG